MGTCQEPQFFYTFIPHEVVINPWQNRLLSKEYTIQKVVVYYYSSRWIPIIFSNLSDAIALHQKARIEGKELYLFPLNLDPNSFNQNDVSLLNLSTVSTILPQSKQLNVVHWTHWTCPLDSNSICWAIPENLPSCHRWQYAHATEPVREIVHTQV